jgi:hypothetical protein
MTKPKPLPASATYRIKATEEAEILRKRLNALLAIPKEGSRDEVQAILAAAEKIGDKIEVERKIRMRGTTNRITERM